MSVGEQVGGQFSTGDGADFVDGCPERRKATLCCRKCATIGELSLTSAQVQAFDSNPLLLE